MLAQLERAAGTATIGFKLRGAVTAIDDLYQQGSAKVRLARAEPDRLSEAVLINTSGGLTDRDQFTANLIWGKGSTAIVTTQAAERIYKARTGTDYTSDTDHASIATNLTIGADATAFWLPQETIMFDRAAYTRKTLIDMAANATLVAIESTLFGRGAMGETIESGSIKEVWQIRIDGKLIFADAFALSGAIDQRLDKPVVTNGARAISTLIYIGPDLNDTRDQINGLIEEQNGTGRAGTVGDIVVTRLFAKTGHALREMSMPIVESLMKKTAHMPSAKSLLPRVWSL